MSARLPAALCLVALVTSTLRADDPQLPDVKVFDKLVVDSLREVHNQGADLYNLKKEFDGTYRMYQGALVAVKPLLAHRPETQKLIEEGLALAEKDTGMDKKAFRLHETIEAVRSQLKGEAAKKPDAKKPDEKKSPEVKNPAAVGGGPGFRGTVTLKGQPLAGGEVVFVSLDQPTPRVFAAAIQANGQYAPMEVVPPGKYVVIVTGRGVPDKYTLTTTSGLVAEVGAPPFVFDIVLP